MGAGSEIGHSAVRAVTGSGHGKDVQSAQEEAKVAPRAEGHQQQQQQQTDYHPCASLTVAFLNVSFSDDEKTK